MAVQELTVRVDDVDVFPLTQSISRQISKLISHFFQRRAFLQCLVANGRYYSILEKKKKKERKKSRERERESERERERASERERARERERESE